MASETFVDTSGFYAPLVEDFEQNC